MNIQHRVIVAGGSGLIGRYLVRHLYDHGYKVIVVSRNKDLTQKEFAQVAVSLHWDELMNGQNKTLFDGDYSIVNLSGENISKSKWTNTFKEKILKSRLESTQKLVQLVNQSQNPPNIFIQASAIGYYDNISGNISTESAPKGRGFLSDTVDKTETFFSEKINPQFRTAIIRTGIVLSVEGGALPKLALPFKYYIGGKTGNGNQWRSWIHYYDEVRAIQHLIENKTSSGIYNLTAPQPLTEKEFGKTLEKVMKRPAWTTIPAPLLRLVFGEMADAILLNGERVIPEKLMKENFKFEFSDLESALKNLFCE